MEPGDDAGRRGAIRRFLAWPRRDHTRIRAEVDEEIAFHLEMRAHELIEQGRSAEAAGEQAEREFGDLIEARKDLMASDVREHRRRRWSDAASDAVRDVRLAARGLARAPLFTAVAVSTLGLGVGANTALFSLVDGVLLKPLPYREPERLVAFSETFLNAEFALVRERARSYGGLAAYVEGRELAIAGAGDPVQVTGAFASANLLDVLGATPALGRGFAAEHEGLGGDPVALLSHGLATDLFGDAASAVGRTIRVDGLARTVISVMPPAFAFPTSQTRIWLPLTLDPADVGGFWGLGGARMVGRLQPTATVELARRELVALAAQLRLENPLWTPNPPYRADVTVDRLADRIVGDARTPLLLLLGATAFVLLIACANVGNLYVVRIAARERDFAVRAALGGGRGRILRTMALEVIVLAACGGGAGLLLAYLGLGALLPFLPADIPRLDQVAMDGRVLGFAAASAFVAAMLFSFLPVTRLLGGTPRSALQEGGRGTGESRRMRQATRAVVVAEVALAVVLLLGATLLARSLAVLYAIDPGFRPEGVTAARISAAPRHLPSDAARRTFYARIMDRIAASPGVNDVAVGVNLMFDHSRTIAAAVEHVTTDADELPTFNFRPISPNFFRVLEIPLLAGRAFTAADRADAPPVAIVDEIAARRFWPGEDPVGKRVGRPWMNEWLTIVGVVGAVKNGDLTAEPLPSIYVPFAQDPGESSTLAIRADRSAGDLAAIVRSAVQEANPEIPVSDVRSLEGLVRGSVSDSRAVTWLLSAFAGLALLLGGLGIYGVLASSVQHRSREIGVRLALGARPSQVRALVLRDGAMLVLLGIGLGVPSALLLGRALQGLLYGVGTSDAVSLIIAPAVLGAAGLLAAFLPALRASRVDPATTLRTE
ncbi:MAG: ADOP family duplicated permease [Longimicrobiales bacterium]